MIRDGKRTVDVQAAVANNLLNLTLLLEIGESLAGEAAVDLQAIDEGSDSDQTVRLNILVELLGGGLVEDDGVLGLVLDWRAERQVSIISSLRSNDFAIALAR